MFRMHRCKPAGAGTPPDSAGSDKKPPIVKRGERGVQKQKFNQCLQARARKRGEKYHGSGPPPQDPWRIGCKAANPTRAPSGEKEQQNQNKSDGRAVCGEEKTTRSTEKVEKAKKRGGIQVACSADAEKSGLRSREEKRGGRCE